MKETDNLFISTWELLFVDTNRSRLLLCGGLKLISATLLTLYKLSFRCS